MPQTRSIRAVPSAADRARFLRRDGETLAGRGRLEEAITRFSEALDAVPGHPETLFQLAQTADRLGMADAAIRFFEQALEAYSLTEAPTELLVGLAKAYRANGQNQSAVDLLRTALDLRADEAPLWHALGTAVREGGDRTTARTFFSEALRLNPGHGAALGSLADLDVEEGNLDRALDGYAQALRRLSKASQVGAQLRLSYALALLQAGRLAEGWAAYSHRFKAQGAAEPSGGRLWRGAPFKDRPLTILREQGVGDQLMVAGLLPGVLANAPDRPSTVTLACEPRLAPLLARSLPDVTVTTDQEALAPGGWILPMADLPSRMWPTNAESAGCPAYLMPDPQQADRWRGWLASLGPGPYVGLCWRSGKQGGLRSGAYAPLTSWIGLARTIPGTLICTQYDGQAEEMAAFREAGVTLHPPLGLDQKQDIDGAAALLSALDLVVTAPTAVAYQAALTGTDTLRLLPTAWWTHLGTGRDAFAADMEDVVASRPEDWDAVFTLAAERIARRFANPR